MIEVVVVYVAPVPVGHRIRVTWHEEVQRGLVPGQERRDERAHQPVILDLDTGVEYASDWAYAAERRRHADLPYDVAESLRPELRVQRIVEGVVTRCRVLTVRGFPETDVQTHLTLSEG